MKSIGRVMLATVIVCARSLGAQGTVFGWYTESRVTSRYVGERAAAMAAPSERRERVWEGGGSMRTEGLPMLRSSGADSYQLVRIGDLTAYQVSPSTHTLRALRIGSLPAEVKDLPSFGVVPRAFKDLGDGGLILGHGTRKTEMRFTVKTLGRTASPSNRTGRETTVTEWVASDTTDPLVAEWFASRPPSTTGKPMRPRGMVLRRESRTDGAAATLVHTTEVIAWRREKLDAALFALPAGYKRVDMADELAAMQRSSAELKRLMASTDPKDRARAKQLSDSLFGDIMREQAKHPFNLRDDPNAVVISDPAPVRKKP